MEQLVQKTAPQAQSDLDRLTARLQTLLTAIEAEIQKGKSLETMWIENVKSALILIMKIANPREGLKLPPKMIGQCLELIATQSEKDMKAFFATPGPENFCMFYYMQRGLHQQDCFFEFNPRHYAGIRKHVVGGFYASVNSGPTMFSDGKNVLALISRSSLEVKLRTQMASFDIQSLFFKCIPTEEIMDRKTSTLCRMPFQMEAAQFLVDQCGANVDRTGFDTFNNFFEKAVYVLDDKISSLDALVFYLNHTKQTFAQVLAKAETLLKTAYGEKAILRWRLAIDVIKSATRDENTQKVHVNVDEASWAIMYKAFASRVMVELEEAAAAMPEPEFDEEELRGLLGKYKADDSLENLDGIQDKLKALGVNGKKRFVELAREVVDEKFAGNFQKYIDAQKNPVRTLRR